MNNKKLFAVAIFLAAAAIKLFYPACPELLINNIKPVLHWNEDYIEIVQTLGTGLDGEQWLPELLEALHIQKPSEQPEVQLQTGETAVLNAQVTPAIQPLSLPDKKQTVNKENPEKVSAFATSQAEFEEMTLPANVSIDMPELPFEYACPVVGVQSSGFGFRLHPIQNVIKFHYGTDYAANIDTEVTAFADGNVYATGTGESYGNYIILTHAEGYSTLYAHLNSIAVHEGDTVALGQVIGKAGQTGSATGPHLHFELLLNDIYINPEYYV